MLRKQLSRRLETRRLEEAMLNIQEDIPHPTTLGADSAMPAFPKSPTLVRVERCAGRYRIRPARRASCAGGTSRTPSAARHPELPARGIARIVRNFSSSKGGRPSPGLLCRKTARWPSVTSTSTPITTKTGRNTTSRKPLETIPSARFPPPRYRITALHPRSPHSESYGTTIPTQSRPSHSETTGPHAHARLRHAVSAVQNSPNTGK